MSKNVGSIDRILRLVVGLLLIAYIVYQPFSNPTYTYVMCAAGVVLALTSIFSFCPIYRIFGLRTCKDC